LRSGGHRKLMSVSRALRTGARIPVRQLAFRARAILARGRYATYPAAPIARALRESEGCRAIEGLPRVPEFIVAPEGMATARSRSDAFAGGRFRFLNQELDFSDGIRWKDAGTSPLWRFHLQYLGAVLDHGLCGRAAEASALVSAWSHEFGTRW